MDITQLSSQAWGFLASTKQAASVSTPVPTPAHVEGQGFVLPALSVPVSLLLLTLPGLAPPPTHRPGLWDGGRLQSLHMW